MFRIEMAVLRLLSTRWGKGLAILTGLLVLVVPEVLARPGGGGGYSGGGGGGGGYSGGGSRSGGGGDLGYLLISLVMKRPMIGIPLVLMIGYAMMKGGQGGRSAYVGHEIRRGNAARMDFDRAAMLAKLKERDTGFDLDAFLDRMRAAFLKIQKAWSDQDMTSARAFVSDGVMERFSLQLQMHKAADMRNDMQDVQILQTMVAQADSDPHFDTIHVTFRASAVDTDVSLSDGKVLRNAGRRAEEFIEVWSFLRRPGAKTLTKPGAIEGQCPCCGDVLELTASAKCGSCGSMVNSGEHDWVLAEITQSCEWTVRPPVSVVPGFAAMQQADPAFSVQFLEDRASVAFWRFQFAMYEPEAKSLAAVAAEEVLAKLRQEQSQEPLLYKNPAVGAVEVLACEQGEPTGGSVPEGAVGSPLAERGEPLDKVHVVVRWSGEKFLVKDGEASSQGQVLRSHVFVMGRKHGVKTDAKSGLSSLACGSCGAPPSTRQTVACEYCGASFNDGSRHWVVTAVIARGLWRMPAIPAVPCAPTAPGAVSPAAALAGAAGLGAAGMAAPLPDWAGTLAPAQGLAILIGGMMLDGQIDKRELAFSQAYAKKHSIPAQRIDQMVQAARKGQLEIPTPKDAVQAEAYLLGLIKMTLADGSISAVEMKSLTAFGSRLQLPPARVQAMAEQERNSMYRRAKQALASR